VVFALRESCNHGSVIPGFRRLWTRSFSSGLHRLLAKRFGTLPEWVDHRLEQASTDQLEIWSLRVLDASCLEQVLTPINE